MKLLHPRALGLLLLASLASCQADPTAPSPTVSLSVDTQFISEPGGEAVVTLTLSSALDSDLDVSLSFSGTASNPDDYAVSAAVVSIPAGATEATTTITAVDDDANDDDETILVSIASVYGDAAASGQLTASITIVDDDEEPGHVRFVLTSNVTPFAMDRIELEVLASDGSQEASVEVLNLGAGFTALVELSPGEKTFNATVFDASDTEIGGCTGEVAVTPADTVEIAKGVCIDDLFEGNNENCELLNGSCDAFDVGDIRGPNLVRISNAQALDDDWFRFTVTSPGFEVVRVSLNTTVSTNFSAPRVFTQSPGSSTLDPQTSNPFVSRVVGTVVYIHVAPADNVDPCTSDMRYSIEVELR